MIRFFRSIRHQLLESRHLSKYLLYALGEVALVMIGILLALQVNNWNENRKTTIEERLYLERLLVDNQDDVKTFHNSILELQKGKETIEDLSNALKRDDLADTILVRLTNEYLKYGSIYPVFTSATSTFDDLSSTGNLKVISNAELRDAVVKHYARHQQVKERIRIDTEWALPMDADFAYHHHIMKFDPLTGFLFPTESPAKLARYLRENREVFLTNATAHYWINTDTIAHLQDIIVETEILVEMISDELGS